MKVAAKRKRVLTKEQIEFRSKILGKKAEPIKERTKKWKPLPQPPKPVTRNQYMNNCMFWINKFEAGREGKEQLMKAVTCLRNHCNQIIQENTP